MKIDHDQFNKGWLPHRYAQIEADGSKFGYMTWQQRPAAERNSASVGLGVYDRRAKQMILAPDPAKRIERLNGQIEDAERKAGEARMAIESIREAMADAQAK